MAIRDPYDDLGVQDIGGYQGPSNFDSYYNNPSNGGGITPPGTTGMPQSAPTRSIPLGDARTSQPGSASHWTPDYISNFIQSRSGGRMHGSSPDYWMSKKAELDARGREINDPEYANKRLAAADEIIGGPQNSPWAPQRRGAGMGGMNLGWLLQMMASRMGPQQPSLPTAGAYPSYEQPQALDIQTIVNNALRGY